MSGLSPRTMCVLASGWGPDGIEAAATCLLEQGVVPRAAVERTDDAGRGRVRRGEHAIAVRAAADAETAARLWLDVRGMAVERVAQRVRHVLSISGARAVRLGVSSVAVAAFAAAWSAGAEDGLIVVSKGEERRFLAPLPLGAIEVSDALVELMTGVGIERCGDLADLPREAVEVRFGGAVVESWRRARADDRRVPFGGPQTALPSASLDFIDHVVTDPERLVWIANALLTNLCGKMTGHGMHARRIWLALPLANGETWRRTLRAARPTASRTIWLRRVRHELERLTVPDAVAGVAMGIDATEPASAVQGDLFDPGFATAASVEAALERLLEAQGTVVVQPQATEHSLAERRTTLGAVEPETLLRETSVGASVADTTAGLTLQLLPEPRPLTIESLDRRDHALPVRYRDGGAWHDILTAAGPERVSGGQWEGPFAREYWRIISVDGSIVWVYRDGRTGHWFLHGWWD